MRLSSCSLAAAGVASRAVSEPWFNRLHITPKGEAVASDGRAIIAVEPVDPERAVRLPGVEPAEAEPGPAGVGLPLDVVASAARSIPKEDKPSLHYAQVTRCDATRVELMTTDGSRTAKYGRPPMRGEFPGWREVVGAAMRGATRSRVLVDRRALSSLLDTVDHACPDKARRNPVFLEVGGPGEPLVLRAFNGETNQHIVGVIRPLSAGGKWLRRGEWEQELAGAGC